MSLNEKFWENHLDKLKNTIQIVVNNNLIGDELKDELFELYDFLDDKNNSLEERKQKAVLVDHYLGMCKDIIDDDINNNRRR